MLREHFARAWRLCIAKNRPNNSICPFVRGGPLLGLPLLKLVSVSNLKLLTLFGASLRLGLFSDPVPVLIDATPRRRLVRRGN
jgi:hypothetical protein